MTSDDRFSWDYKPSAQRLEPVKLAPPLWTLTKNGHSAAAQVRSIDGVGLELRFSIDDSLYQSQIFRDWPSLEQAAGEKKEFLGTGLEMIAAITRAGRCWRVGWRNSGHEAFDHSPLAS